ncbi:MAG: dTDP-4-dehydrorhamnose 3,5-epimerase [Acidobacteriota bacterium]|nr:dTDP-4-dehydrorhamnose 3,5-epimerase [Acidobacteriota bacterium]
MIFTPATIGGAYVIDPERLEDERGFFARTYCEADFLAHGLSPVAAQCNISFNAKRATLRGMHYQAAPHEETKLVRCTMGAIYDVIVDLRPGPTLHRWEAVELSAQNRRMLYIPEGVAHGFITLEDATEVFYQMATAYTAEAARGVRWNDPAFAITWPLAPEVISARDAAYPLV